MKQVFILKMSNFMVFYAGSVLYDAKMKRPASCIGLVTSRAPVVKKKYHYGL